MCYCVYMASESVIKELTIDQANLGVVNTKLHSYHWHIQGPHFFELHEHTEEWYKYVFEFGDEVAERILQLGAKPLSSLKEYLDSATISEETRKSFGPKELLAAVQGDLEALEVQAGKVLAAAEEVGDVATGNLYEDHIQWIGKTLWMVRQAQA